MQKLLDGGGGGVWCVWLFPVVTVLCAPCVCWGKEEEELGVGGRVVGEQAEQPHGGVVVKKLQK